MFDHYLITRFNLKTPEWDVTKNNELLLTDEWMDNRMWLFENFCFSTVVAQTNKNFTWLLYFDDTTKTVYKNRIAQLIENHNNIKVFYIDGMAAFYPELKKFIHNESQDKPYLITSRIDNDDSIHIDFIDEVQKQFNKQDYRAIDFINGYSLQIEPCFILGRKEHLFNPFISLIEKNNNPKTALHNDHTKWKRDKNVTQIGGKRLWLSIIHQRNKVNKFDGYGNIKWKTIKKDFVVSKEADNLIEKNLIPFGQWHFVSLKNQIVQKFELNFKLLKRKLGFYKSK